MLSKSDIKQLKVQGKEVEKVRGQVKNFIDGFPYMQLNRAAILGDGIIRLSKDDIEKAVNFYNNTLGEFKIIKFIPASGAASRMFKDLFSFMNDYSGSVEDIRKLREDDDYASIKYFFDHIKKYAFYDDLEFVVKKDEMEIPQLISEHKFQVVLQYLLTEKGLNYGNLPKGLLKFS